MVDAGVDNRSGTHGTGFESDIERCAKQPPTAERAAGLVNRKQFRMGECIFIGFPPVVCLCDDLAAPYKHSADRHLAKLCRPSRLFEREPHISLMFQRKQADQKPK